MSLNILLSNTVGGAINFCLDKLVENYSLSKKYVVLTTDRNTLYIEQKILSMLGSGGAANIDVANFSRISSRHLPTAKKCLTPEGAVLLMSKAATLVKDKLTYYSNSALNEGFIRDAYMTITALRNCSVTSEALRKTSDAISGNLALKTKDLALLYDEYIKLLSVSYYDGTSRLEAFGELLGNKNPFDGAEVYIVGFTAFNGQSLALIDKLVTRSEKLTVALPCYPLGDNARIYPMKTLRQIREIFSRYDVKCNEEVRLSEGEYKNAVQNLLFSYEKIKSNTAGNLELYSAKSQFSEIEFIAYSIRKSIVRDKLRYKQIALVCPSVEQYKDAIAKYFELYDIPYHIDEDESIERHALVRLINGIFETVTHNFNREKLFKLLKNPLLNFNSAHIFSYENFCIAYGINYNRLLDISELESFDNFDKYSETAKKVADCCSIIGKIKDKGNPTEIVAALLEIFDELRIEDSLAVMEQEAFDKQDNAIREMTKHIFRKVKEILAVIVMINGDTEITIKDFYTLYKSSVCNNKMVLLPVSNDCVVVRTVENTNADGIKSLYICGTIEGIFPLETSEQTIISLKEADILHKNNCPFEPTRKDNAIGGRFGILQLLASDYEKLTITYPESKADGTSCVFSHIAARLAAISGVKAKSVESVINFYSLSACNETTEDILGTEENAKRIFLSRIISLKGAVLGGVTPSELALYDSLYKILVEKKQYIDSGAFVASSVAEKISVDALKLYFERPKKIDKNVSVSELEKYFGCPAMHFLAYGLSAKKRKEAEIASLDIGLIIHGILENYFSIIDYAHLDIARTVVRLLNSREEVIAYRKREKDIAVEMILSEVVGECVEIIKTMREYEDGSEFKLYALEKYFDTKAEEMSGEYAEVNGEKIFFNGRIDRIDRCGDKIILFDYKTGSASAALNSIYYGNKLQLYFYMYCLTGNKKKQAAAAYYIPISAKYEKDKISTSPFVGLAILDEDTLLKIDKNALDEGRFVRIKHNKDGSLSKVQNGLMDSETFNAICKYTMMSAKNAVKEICDGYIAKKPSKGTCDFCDFASVCDFSTEENKFRNTGNKVKGDAFVEAISGCDKKGDNENG